MKKSQSLSILLLAATLIFSVSHKSSAAVQAEFWFDEYEFFHDVLQPLQHEALPQGDFKRIRAMATALVTRGKAVVRVGIPGAPQSTRRKFETARKKFDKSLDRFRADARTGNDARLQKSFAAVHHSFERLEDSLPAVFPISDPPIITIECPSSKVQAGTEITLTASAPVAEFRYLWKATVGKIVDGQGTRKMTMDTTGLAGQTTTVTVEVSDGNGHVAVTSCVVQVSPSRDLEPGLRPKE